MKYWTKTALLAVLFFVALPVAHAQDCQFGDGSVMQDLDGDGQLTPTDLALWFKDQVGEAVMEDLDGDGVLTPNDLMMFLRQFVRNMAGDLDGDGTVTELDMVALIQNVGADSGILVNSGDLNDDGVVDEEDFLILADRLGCPLDDATIDGVAAGIQASLWFLPSGEVKYDMGAGDHTVVFSDTWVDHGTAASNFWPPNHDGTISVSWVDPPVHNELQSEFWPANHFSNFSELWDIVDHSENGSENWPLNHKLQRSQTWPSTHKLIFSRSWPPNHLAADSAIDGQSPHETETSTGWPHGEESSEAIWPPSHPQPMSSSWISHDQAVSATWPPGHISFPSSTWPGDQPWPPNHFEFQSSKWINPPSSTPIMPPDHSLWDSFLDLIPLFEQGQGEQP